MCSLSDVSARLRPAFLTPILLSGLFAAVELQAQIELERVFPPVIARNGVTPIKAEGKFPAWPPTIYCDRADIRVQPLEESGELEIHVPADAAQGVAWLRLLDSKSVSKPVPLCIDMRPVVLETEPNAKYEVASHIDIPSVICGRLEKKGDVDCYRIRLSKGQALSAKIVANQVLGSPMDSVLQLVDPKGHIINQNDDSVGLDPCIDYVSPVDQEIMVRLFAFPETPNSTIGFAGGAALVYQLRLESHRVIDHCLPLLDVGDHSLNYEAFSTQGLVTEPNVALKRQPATEISPAIVYSTTESGWQWLPRGFEGVSILESTTLDASPEAPFIFSGHIATPAEVDSISFEARKDSTYEIRVHSQKLGFALDSTLRVVDPDGKEMAKNDDLARRQYDAGLNFQATRDGPLTVLVEDLADSSSWRHAYGVTVQEVRPGVDLRLNQDQFSVAAGEAVSFKVTVSRQHGCDKALDFRGIGLPTGVRLTGERSESKGKTSGTVELKIETDREISPGHYRFRIGGFSGQQSSLQATCRYNPTTGIDAEQLWLTIY